ncbi:MAG TPA: hypothetical protein VI298_06690 [Geobacteraceae bacterium]
MRRHIEFKIEGPAFREEMPLHDILAGLQEFQSILDRSYLAVINGHRMFARDRYNFNIQVNEFKRGSFAADLQLVCLAAAQTLPNFPGIQIKDIWDVAKNAYDFLKLLATKRSEGIEPEITIGGDNLAPIIVGNNITISNVVFAAADRAEPNFKKLTSLIQKGHIDTISTLSADNYGIVVTESDKKLFNPKTIIDREMFTIECNIIRYDKFSKRGKLFVYDNQDIPPKEYQFKQVRAGDSNRLIMAMAKERVTIEVHKEIEVHTSGVERISSLLVMNFIHMPDDQIELF